MRWSSVSFQRNASLRAGPAGSQTCPTPMPKPTVPQVAHRAPGSGEREGPEDPARIPEGRQFTMTQQRSHICDSKIGKITQFVC